MRGYTFDRSLAVERAKAVSKVFREQQQRETTSEIAAPKPPVLLHKSHDDNLYVTPEPRVPTYVIWIAAGCVVLVIIVWALFSAAQTRRRLQYLERLVMMLAQKQGVYITNGF